ncbi:MAG: UDP-glucose 4-epimerase GalE [Planctomycetota bacterium]|nr:UDP-glucose 4-epimerase GalE [Planctomycetota bacterium]
MNVLITGGAGYIGSHLIDVLSSAGHNCTVYDNLINGHAQAVGDAKLIVGDISDTPSLTAAMRENDTDAVIHLAAFIEAGESVERPEKYFRNNTLGGLALLEAMQAVGVTKMVFSSTAAVYGLPIQIEAPIAINSDWRALPISETDHTEPINPYGAGKLCVEFMLRAFAQAYGMGFAALRYFNVAGAHPSGRIGEAHNPETHLIPLVLQVPLGRNESVKIFGDDYDTPDGTCIRDYIHVMDLAAAHVLALEAIEPGAVKVFNLGNGEGFSVRQVIESCRSVTDHPIPADVAPRRPGDPPHLVASSRKAKDELGWRCEYPDLNTIVTHAWGWHKTHPNGYD